MLHRDYARYCSTARNKAYLGRVLTKLRVAF